MRGFQRITAPYCRHQGGIFMKIKVSHKSYDEVIALPPHQYRKPRKSNLLFKTLVKLLSQADIKATDFTWTSHGMDRLAMDEPFLILMNHSSFIDLKIVSHILYPRSYNIICTSDGFVGQEWLIRRLGCIPTKKFVFETLLLRDMHYALHELKCPVLMYPEASYTFDGTQTPLPDSLGKCLKYLKVPVVSIITRGAFARVVQQSTASEGEGQCGCDLFAIPGGYC